MLCRESAHALRPAESKNRSDEIYLDFASDREVPCKYDEASKRNNQAIVDYVNNLVLVHLSRRGMLLDLAH